MLQIALSIAIFAYLIFFLGVVHLLYPNIIAVLFIAFVFVFIASGQLKSVKVGLEQFVDCVKFSRLSQVAVVLLILEAGINMVGALGPEISFDALWYHLTLPKIYIAEHLIDFIPGSLFYYSLTPKLADMLFVPALMGGGETVAKLIHFAFGILCCAALYRFSRAFVSSEKSILAVLIFYSNIVVAWESTVAYVDLAWSFFVILAVSELFFLIKEKKEKHLTYSAVFLGLSICSKVISLRDVFVFVPYLLFVMIEARENLGKISGRIFKFLFLTLLIPLPWFVFSYVHTKNPVYPFFTKAYSLQNPDLFSAKDVVTEFGKLFLNAPDPVLPIYFIFLPLIIIGYKSAKPLIKKLVIFLLLALVMWYATYQKGAEARYAIPYLAVFSIVCVVFIDTLGIWVKRFLIGCIIFLSIVTILYRGAANSRYLPVILGFQSKHEYLVNNLNYSYGDFYDVDGYFEDHITHTDRVLIYNIHNLYYVNFPFIESSYLVPGDFYNYVLVRGVVPEKYEKWKKVYQNKKTGVKLYKK